MTLIFIIIAALFGATVNFCLRKNFENQKSASGYLVIYFVFSFFISFLVGFKFNFYSFSLVMCSMGIVAGTLNLIMMLLVARALKIGPSGLTFAFQNSASLFPTIVLFLVFGSSFGFSLDIPLIIGFLSVLTGLFISVRTPNLQLKDSAYQSSSKTPQFSKWLILALAIFLIQGTILSIFQWRSLLLTYPAQSHFLLPWNCSLSESLWFMPGFFLVPTLVQSTLYGITERRWFSRKEFKLGTIAGSLNGGSTFCLLMATRLASSEMRPILFPLFAVTVIFLCNLWGNKFYREPIDWKGMSLCIGGILIASI